VPFFVTKKNSALQLFQFLHVKSVIFSVQLLEVTITDGHLYLKCKKPGREILVPPWLYFSGI